MRTSSLPGSLLATALALTVAAPARAELRISDLAVFLNDQEVTVHVVLLGAAPDGFQEGIQSGIPAHVRFTVELWRYKRYWPDQLLTTKVVERALVYNVVTKEFRVTSLKGEARPVHITRDARDAQRVLSELRGLKMGPASALDANAVIYVRVNAEAALNGENTFLARMAGTAEQTFRQSDYRTIQRVQ
jgi:uncharacterized protein YbjQ (UPF0145 family)